MRAGYGITGAFISIHALREEGDIDYLQSLSIDELFLSTPSARRATSTPTTTLRPPSNFYPRPPRGGRPAGSGDQGIGLGISIHALREEGDLLSSLLSAHFGDFYPRPPRGGRPWTGTIDPTPLRFLSTPSARRATDSAGKLAEAMKFLSTPSARRATTTLSRSFSTTRYFYPRPPRGGRLVDNLQDVYSKNFYPRPPRGGRRPTSSQ